MYRRATPIAQNSNPIQIPADPTLAPRASVTMRMASPNPMMTTEKIRVTAR